MGDWEAYLEANDQLQRELAERRQAEDALRKSEEQYRVLMETASDAIFAADGETGIIADANQKSAELLGIPKAQIIGLHQSQLHPPEDAEKYRDLFRRHVARGGIISDEVYVINHEGSRIPVEISASTTVIGPSRTRHLQGYLQA